MGLLLLFLIPVGVFVVYSFLTPGQFTVSGPLSLNAYKGVFNEHVNYELGLRSLRTGVIGGFFTCLLALPIAYWLRYLARPKVQIIVLFVVAASLFASYIVRIYAWQTILGGEGLINGGLERLGIISEPLGFLLFSPVAVAIAAVHLALPFAIISLFAALRPLEPSYLEAAESLGAGAFQRWWRVILPSMAQALMATFLFVVLLASSDWLMSQILGGTRGVMLGVRVRDTFLAVGDLPSGAALSIVLMLTYLVIFVLSGLLLRLFGVSKLRWV